MLQKVFGALFIMTVSLGLVAADELNGVITKVEKADKDFKVTFQKMKGKGKNREKDGDPMTFAAAADAKVNKGKGAKGGKIEVGDAIEKGLANEMFSKIDEKGLRARVTTDTDNKCITEFVIIQFGGKGKKDDKKDDKKDEKKDDKK